MKNKLPILNHENEINSFLSNKDKTCLLITGTTGSGKSTEVPSICLRNLTSSTSNPKIVVSQPRRLAAIELGRYLQLKHKNDIGYRTRFVNHTSSSNKIIFLTDGILFKELSEPNRISKYSVIIIDEVHERSIATELLLGILKMHINNSTFKGKIILMSSTIDTKQFSDNFNNLSIINIQQRTFEISKVYINRNFKDINKEIVNIIKNYFIEPNQKENSNCLFNKEDKNLIDNFINDNKYKGTILIFLPGIDHINSLYNSISTISKKTINHKLKVYKLHSKTPNFVAKKTISLLKSKNGLNIVISTNVAETSLTIPNVKYVIDIGLVKKKFFLDKLQLEIIKLMPISKQEAVQREGRCGRTQEGLCIKLYTKETAKALPENIFCSIIEDDYSEFILYIIKNNNLNDFPFLNKLKKEKLKRSLMFLLRLEIINNKGKIKNETIEKMLKFPLHPKYIKIIIKFNELHANNKDPNLFNILVVMIVLINEDSVSDYLKNSDDDTKNKNKGDLLNQLLYVTNNENNNKRLFKDIEKKVLQIVYIYNKLFKTNYNTVDVLRIDKNCDIIEVFNKAVNLLMTGMSYNVAKIEKGNKYKTLITSMEVNIHSGSKLYNKGKEYILFDKLFQNNKVYCRNCEEVKEDDIVDYVPTIFRRI